MKIRATITGVAVAMALGATPAVAQEPDEEPRNPRAQGAPGFFCKQAGARPGSPEFRACVRLAAKARRQARQDDEGKGNPNARSLTAPGRFCKANGATPGSEPFRACVKTAAKARRVARS